MKLLRSYEYNELLTTVKPQVSQPWVGINVRQFSLHFTKCKGVSSAREDGSHGTGFRNFWKVMYIVLAYMYVIVCGDVCGGLLAVEVRFAYV